MNKYPVETRFAKYNAAGSVGLAAMAIKDGKTVYKEGYGLRNTTTKEPIDANTNFRLASISKQFTAMCIAILEENGDLSDKDPITKHFENLPGFMDEIRIHHLLHHTSGLPDCDELYSTNKELPLLSNVDIYDFYFSDEIDFNTGNALIGQDGIYCSLNDTEKWINALECNTLVGKEMMQKIFTSGFTNAGDKVNYEYGWSWTTLYNKEMINHGGRWLGSNTAIVNFPTENIWIVTYSNSLAVSAGNSMREIAQHFLNTR